MSLSSPCCLSQWAASGVGLLLTLSVLGIFAARRAPGSRLIYAACMAVCAGLAGVALITVLAPAARLESVEIPIGLPLGRTFLGLDPLSAAFAFIINLAASIVSGYAIGYGAHAREPLRVVPFYPAFIAGMNLVLLAQDAFSFLVGWELMSLASWALVLSEHRSAENRRAATLLGINVDRTIAMTFFIGSAIAAFGGITVAILYNAVYTSMGDMVGYKGLALIVIGGFGSMTGAVLAAFILGITETVLTTYADIPLSRDGIAMLMLVVLILFRPQGLLGKA